MNLCLSTLYKRGGFVVTSSKSRRIIRKRKKGSFAAWVNHELYATGCVWFKFNFIKYFTRVEQPEDPAILRKDWFLMKHGVRRKTKQELLDFYEKSLKKPENNATI